MMLWTKAQGYCSGLNLEFRYVNFGLRVQGVIGGDGNTITWRSEHSAIKSCQSPCMITVECVLLLRPLNHMTTPNTKKSAGHGSLQTNAI